MLWRSRVRSLHPADAARLMPPISIDGLVSDRDQQALAVLGSTKVRSLRSADTAKLQSQDVYWKALSEISSRERQT